MGLNPCKTTKGPLTGRTWATPRPGAHTEAYRIKGTKLLMKDWGGIVWVSLFYC